ncbi:MAG: hypothetical protein Fur009_5410 [Candidatus Microgenomates bacterium]
MKILPAETPQPSETSPRPNSTTLNSLYSILNSAEQQISAFNNYFSQSANSKQTVPTQSLQGLVIYLETIPVKKIDELPFKPESISDFYSLTPSELINYLETLNIQQHQKQKIIEGWLAKRIIDIAVLKRQGIDLDPKTKINFLKKPNQLNKILQEINLAESLESWDLFYRIAPLVNNQLQQANTQEHFEQIKNALKQYSLPENSIVLKRLNEIIDERKRQTLSSKDKTMPTEKKQKEDYENALKQSLNYLRYSSKNNNEKGSFTIRLVEETLNILSKIRDSRLTPFTEAWRLAENFWPLRLGRKEVIKKLPKKIRESLRNYYEANLDKSLRTEAAGFWIEKNLNLPNLQTMSNDQRIIFTLRNVIETLRKNHDPSKPLTINLNLDDEHIIKFSFNLSENIDEQIRSQLQLSSLKKGNLVRLKHLKPEELFSLKQDAYTFGEIQDKSKTFKQAFGHPQPKKILGIQTPFSTTSPDDYAVRINTGPKKRPKNSPFSLFMVEHHKALFNFDIDGAKINIALKFAHKSFDGKPAKDLFLKLIKQLKKQAQEYFNYEPTSLPVENEDLPPIQIPIFETSASVKFDEVLSDIKTEFNPSFVYGLATAVQAGADSFHFLVAGPNIFSEAGPYSNIQPAVVSLIPIKDIVEKIKNNSTLTGDELSRLQKWREYTKSEYEKARKGLSTPAVISAVAGRQEKPLSEVARIFGHQGVRLLTNASGMFSALVSFKTDESTDEIIFHTAKSDSYQQKINLENPPTSMGVVGFNQSQDVNGNVELVFAVRKMPSQAQPEISQWLKNKGIKNLRPFNQLLQAWESLIKGEIKLDRYYAFLQKAYDTLPTEAKKSLQGDFKNLQIKLNELLQQSATNTTNPNIAQTVLVAEKLLTL